jgi:dGTPase
LPAERDRDRILYSSAFRRLGGVTQVLGASEIQLLHNRLTHSLKVAQIGRRLAERILRDAKPPYGNLEKAGWIDPDVVESACMAHDLGHPPFGHIGEEELDACVQAHGIDGFEGNAQSFRIVTKLSILGSQRGETGLNLTRATLRALLKYPWTKGSRASTKSHKKWGAYFSEEKILKWALKLGPLNELCAEAKIMDVADDITYAVHDVEDFVRSGLIPVDALATQESERRRFLSSVESRIKSGAVHHSIETMQKSLMRIRPYFPVRAYSGSIVDRGLMHSFASSLITRFLGTITLSPAGGLQIPDETQEEIDVLKELNWCYVINDPALASSQRGHRKLLKSLFDDLYEWTLGAWEEISPEHARLPMPLRNLILTIRDDSQAKAAMGRNEDLVGKLCARSVADYIASLTEMQAHDLHRRMVEGAFGSSALQPWLRR